MSRRLQENLVAALILAVFIAAIVASLNYGPRARMVPIPIAALGAILVICQMVLQNFRSEDELRIDLLEFISDKPTEAEAEMEGAADSERKGASFKVQAGAFGLVAVMLGLFLVVGPIPTMFVFTAGYFVLSRHFSIVRGLVFALVMTALVYFVFTVGLKIDLSHGLIDPTFGLF
jgi:hypothetical protein